MAKITETLTGVTVGNIMVAADVNGNIKDGGMSIAQIIAGEASGTVTSVSVATANGFAGTVANPTTTPAITIKTSVTGIMKGNGTAASAAVSGTDYAPATSGSAILKANGAGGFSNAVADTDYQAPISLTTTGTGAATFTSDTLNVPTPVVQSLTTTGSGAATLVGGVLNIPTPAGATITSQQSNIPFASAVSLTSGTSKTVTSLSLAAGTWLVQGSVFMNDNTTITMIQGVAGISQTADTFDDLSYLGGIAGTAAVGTFNNIGASSAPRILVLGSPGTVYLIAQATSTGIGDSLGACGNLTAIKLA